MLTTRQEIKKIFYKFKGRRWRELGIRELVRVARD